MKPVEKGILISLTAYACYAVAAFMVKTLALSPQLIVFARNTTGFCFFLPLFLLHREKLKTKRLSFHCARSGISLATIYCSTYGIQHLSLGDAILLEQTAPFFILLLLFIWNGRKISLPSLLAIVAAFAGVGYILKPHFHLLQIAALASLGAAFFLALSLICMESLGKTEPALCILFYFFLISSLLSFAPAMGHWNEITSYNQGFLLLLVGVIFALFQLLLTRALMLADANVIGSYTFSGTLFSIILGTLFLDEELTFPRILGSSLILLAGLYIFYEKRKSKTVEKSDMELGASSDEK